MKKYIVSDVVGAYEAKTHFSELLEKVAQGEEITITRHGHPVAKLVPMTRESTPERRRWAIEGIKKFRERNLLGGLDIKELITEGRR